MKAILKIVLSVCAFLILIFCSCKKDEYGDMNCNLVNSSFRTDIQPLVMDNCTSAGCHDAGSKNGDFTSYKGIKGKVNNGSFEKRVLIKKDMPSGRTLSLEDRKRIKCWLNNGAPEN